MSSFGGKIDEVIQMEETAHIIKDPRRKATLTGLPPPPSHKNIAPSPIFSEGVGAALH